MVLTIFPVSLYEDLLPKIVAVLELTQQINGMTNQEAKQNLLQATNAFKNAISQAKEFATNLPGGELTIDQQNDVIKLLENLKERKEAQLVEFACNNMPSKSSAAQVKMEIDSVASTPASL